MKTGRRNVDVEREREKHEILKRVTCANIELIGIKWTNTVVHRTDSVQNCMNSIAKHLSNMILQVEKYHSFKISGKK